MSLNGKLPPMKTTPANPGRPLLVLLIKSLWSKVMPKPETYPIRYYKKGKKDHINDQEFIH